MINLHRVQSRILMILQAGCLFHPIDGPGVDLPKIVFFLTPLIQG